MKHILLALCFVAMVNTSPVCPIEERRKRRSVDCLWAPWSAWTLCSEPCGRGSRSRYRLYLPDVCGRTSCSGSHTVSQSCNLDPSPPVNCAWSNWSSWGACSVSCGSGTRQRRRTETSTDPCGRSCSGSVIITQSCNTNPNPVDCELTSWSAYTTCTVSCGGGMKTRSRAIKTQPSACGKACDTNMSENIPCNSNCCPVNCAWSNWSPWGACSVSCGTGTRQKTRTKTKTETCGGTCAGAATTAGACSTNQNPVDCQLSTWGAWKQCSVSCGGGQRTRERYVAVGATACGLPCSGSLSQTGLCGASCCPVNCAWSNWSSWGACSVSCGSGTRQRSRTKTTTETCGGTCSGSVTDSQACNTNPNPVDCELTSWSAYTTCTVSCGGGMKTRSRAIKTQPSACGKACDTNMSENVPCNSNCCPVNCAWSIWSSWGACSVSCGTGTRQKTRTKTKTETCGGTCAGAATTAGACSTNPNPVDCQLSTWGAWKQCSVSCGGGQRTRERYVAVGATACGLPCSGSLSQTGLCGASCCPVGCQWGPWGAWGACTPVVECGGLIRTRKRTKAVLASCGGEECTRASSDTDSCGISQPCPINCTWAAWSEWGPCSSTCGVGTKSRTRSKVVMEQNGGTCIGHFTDVLACNQELPAAVDCKWSDWIEWSRCTQSCGGGLMIRTREVKTEPSVCGQPCGERAETRDCSVNACDDPSLPTTTASHDRSNVSEVDHTPPTSPDNLPIIIGTCVGGLVLIVLIVAIVIVVVVRKRTSRRQNGDDQAASANPSMVNGDGTYEDLQMGENHYYCGSKKDGSQDTGLSGSTSEYSEILDTYKDNSLYSKVNPAYTK